MSQWRWCVSEYVGIPTHILYIYGHDLGSLIYRNFETFVEAKIIFSFE